MTSIRPSENRFKTHLTFAEKGASGITTLNTHFKQNGYTTISNGKAFHHPDQDLIRSQSIGNRMEQTLERRMRHARIESLLYLPGYQLSVAAQKLGEELREKTRIEARCESVDSQIEVFEHVYEMASQRLGEFRDARYGHKLEWIIILILAAEMVWLIAEFLMQLEY